MRKLLLIFPILFFITLTFFLTNSRFDVYEKSLIQGRYSYYDIRFREGDSIKWISPRYNDSLWNREQLPVDNNLWYLRLKQDVTNQFDPGQIKGLAISFEGSYQLYWDGILIGENGKPGKSSAEEIPGDYIRYFSIPDSLAGIGMHQLTFRISNFYSKNQQFPPSIILGNLMEMVRRPMVITLLINFVAGVFLIGFLYYLFQYLFRRKNYLILFSTLCFLLLLLLITEYLKFYVSYPYPLQHTRLKIIQYLTLGIAYATTLFILYRFSFPRKRYVITLLSVLCLAIFYFEESFDERALYAILAGLACSGIVVLKALVKKEKGAWSGAYSIAACVTCLAYYDITLFLGYASFIIFMLYGLSVQDREEKEKYQKALLKTAALELELIKKNIQPHFLLNTLTSLISLIRTDKNAGIHLIHLLAKEFEILNEVASLKKIPVKDEIDLIETHLGIMRYRKDIDYTLKLNNIDSLANIPPAIFLTIIENGITHNKPVNGKIEFTLSSERHKEQQVYTILATGMVKQKDAKDGMGLQYIKIRLEESYPGKWTLNSQPHELGWITHIKFST